MKDKVKKIWPEIEWIKDKELRESQLAAPGPAWAIQDTARIR